MEVEGWGEYRKLVLAQLEKLEGAANRHEADVAELRVEVAMLKVKAGLWGALAGAIPGAIAILWGLLK